MNRGRKIKQMRHFINKYGYIKHEYKLPKDEYYRKGSYYACFIGDSDKLVKMCMIITDIDKYTVYKIIMEEIKFILKNKNIQTKFTWKDIVLINSNTYAEEFPISGRIDVIDGEDIYQIDDFIDAVAKKHGVNSEDVETYMMDGINFNPEGLPFGIEECGCYINGVPEWSIKNEEDGVRMELIDKWIKIYHDNDICMKHLLINKEANELTEVEKTRLLKYAGEE